jgi:hypothetical protein
MNKKIFAGFWTLFILLLVFFMIGWAFASPRTGGVVLIIILSSGLLWAVYLNVKLEIDRKY